jgi:O-antigen/teichoic acid export membrane protein
VAGNFWLKILASPDKPRFATVEAGMRSLQSLVAAPLLRSSGALILSTFATSGLGFLFWIIAARTFPTAEVGFASAIIASMMLVMTLSICGLDHLSSRFLPVTGKQKSIFTVGVQLGAFTTGCIGGLVFWLGSGLWSDPVSRFGIAFVLLAGLCTLSVVQDHVFVGLNASKWIPITKGAMAVGRVGIVLIAPILLAFGGGTLILWAWGTMFLAANVFGVILSIRHSTFPQKANDSNPQEIRQYLRFAGFNHLGTLLSMLPTLAFPALVLNFLGDEASAYFYLSWMIGSLLLFSISNVAIAFVAQTAEREEELGTLLRSAFRYTYALVVPGVIVLLLGAPWFLSLLGPGYDTAARCLQIIAIACLFFPVNAFYVAVMRLRQSLAPIVWHGALSGGSSLALALYLGPAYGITGFGIAFLLGQVIGALIVLFIALRTIGLEGVTDRAASVFASVARIAWRYGHRINSSGREYGIVFRHATVSTRRYISSFPPHSLPRSVVIPASLARVGSAIGAANFVGVGLALSALTVWASSLASIETSSVSDLGLASVLPIGYVVALVLTTAGFCVSLKQRKVKRPAATANLVALAIILYATPALIYESARGAIAYRHVGVSEMISRTGTADPMIDAYTNWPGFFATSSVISEAMGYDSPLVLVNWFPLGINLISISLIGLLAHMFFRDRRAAFLSMWFFLLANWVGQDYFAPQAFGFILYLGIIILLFFALLPHAPRVPEFVRWAGSHLGRVGGLQAKITGWTGRGSGILARWTMNRQIVSTIQAQQAIALENSRSAALKVVSLILVIILFAAVVYSHQVSPVAIIISVTALYILHRFSLFRLPLIMALIMLSWWIFMAFTFFAGHFEGVSDEVGTLGRNLQENVVQRLPGDADRVFSAERTSVLQTRMILTAGIIGLAIVGTVRRFAAGYLDIILLTLAAAPLSLMLLGSHGGEILMRASYFALPFICILAAAAFIVRSGQLLSWTAVGLLAVTSLLIATGFLVAKYGNERIYHFTTSEVAAVDFVYDRADADTLLIAGSWNTPWRHRSYENISYLPLEEESVTAFQLEDLQTTATDWNRGEVYVVITRSQRAHFELLLGRDPELFTAIEVELQSSPSFENVFSNSDASVYRYVRPESVPVITRPAWNLVNW